MPRSDAAPRLSQSTITAPCLGRRGLTCPAPAGLVRSQERTAMKTLLALAGLAASVIAGPALAQTVSPYAQELAQLKIEQAQMPGGGNEKDRDANRWQQTVVRAEAKRAGEPITHEALQQAMRLHPVNVAD